VLVLTREDYIKRMAAEDFEPQHCGGKGIIGVDCKEGDCVVSVLAANSHDTLLCFTDRGEVHRLKVYEVPEMSRTARGTAAANLLNLDDGETIAAAVPVGDLQEDSFVTTVTAHGYTKRTPATEFENILSTGIIAADVDADDALVDAAVTDGDGDLLIATREGMSIRFDETEVRSMGRNARGVKGVELRGDDVVAGLVAADDSGRDLLTVTENGYGKRTPLAEYRTQSRYGKGLVDIDTGDRNGPVVAVADVTADDHLIVMSEGGQIMRTRAGEISTVGRNTKGVRIMDLDETDTVACMATVDTDCEEDKSE
jgi:DNA gyrase subunit A